jgi:hypothetical protein
VSVPADTGAVITERALRSGTTMSAVSTKHLIRASEAVDEADRHHEALGRHLDSGDDRAAGAAHRRLGRCIRDAQRCFRALADQAVLDDIHATQSLQTSSGVTKGTSSFTAPLSRAERQLEALRLQLPAGGAVDAAATRDREFLHRLVHREQVGRAMATDGDFAERQRELRRLARLG